MKPSLTSLSLALLTASALIGLESRPGAQTLYRLNAGGATHVDAAGNTWVPDGPYANTGEVYETTMPVAGTSEPALYMSERWDRETDPELLYSLPVPPGTYRVRLHFAEIYSLAALPGERVFDVSIEGTPVLTDFDITAAVGPFMALVREFVVDSTDGSLEIEFHHGVENPKISAIEVEALAGASLQALPAAIDFGTSLLGESTSIPLTLTSIGSSTVMVDGLLLAGEQPEHFSIAPVLLPVVLDPGQSLTVDLTFEPLSRGSASAELVVSSDATGGTLVVPLLGDGIVPPAIEVAPTELDLGSVLVSESSTAQLTVTNRGDLDLEITSIDFVGDALGEFTSDASLPLSIPLDESRVIDITFEPTGPGDRSAVLEFVSNDPSGGPSVPLTGSGRTRRPPNHAPQSPKVTTSGSVTVPAPGPQLEVSAQLDVGEAEVGSSVTTDLVLTNAGNSSLLVSSVVIVGSAQFTVALSPPLHVPVHASRPLPITFTPTEIGSATAKLMLLTNEGPGLDQHQTILSGTGIEPEPSGPATLFLAPGTDPSGIFSGTMSADSTYAGGNDLDPLRDALTPAQIFADSAENDMQGLFVDAVEYSVSIPETGDWYLWGRFYFPGTPNSNEANSFWVSVDGKKAQKFGNNHDQFRVWHWDGDGIVENGALAPLPLGVLVAGPHTLRIGKREVVPVPPRLDVLYLTTDPLLPPTDVQAEQALYPVGLTADPAFFVWGHVPVGQEGVIKPVTLTNEGDQSARITRLGFHVLAGVGHDFTALLDGTLYTGGHDDVTHTVDVIVPAHSSLTVPLQFLPTEPADNAVDLVIEGIGFRRVTIRLEGAGAEETGDPFLHVVIGAPDSVVDGDHDGSETVELQGSLSHTHEFGHDLVSFEWLLDGTPLASTADTTALLSVGTHTVSLTITDDNVPPRTLTDSKVVEVFAPESVPGALVLYYPGGPAELPAFLDAPPANADHGEIRPRLEVQAQGGLVGSTPYAGDVMVRFLASVDLSSSATYTFLATGGIDRRLFVDGSLVEGALALVAGRHTVEARFAVDSVDSLPLTVTHAVGGDPQTPIAEAAITHDETALVPVINSAPSSGLDAGGNLVRITGLGFTPTNQVVVHWGASLLSGAQLTVTPTTIDLVAPPGLGLITVTVENPNGVSNAIEYAYSPTGPIPVVFDIETVASITNPTQAAWGPDGRLYVASVSGTITALEFDDDYGLVDAQTITTLESAGSNNVLGLTFSPFDPPGTVRLYVAHSELFANGGACVGSCPDAFSSYSGTISVLEGPAFDSALPLIRGLPVSNHDHGINGIEFGNDGALYICVGGNTNAGVIHCNIGELPESPYSGALLRAPVHDPSFVGEVDYLESDTAQLNNNQVCGHLVDSANTWISVFAAGLRNPYDLALTTRGRIFATDNGPNFGFGAASTSATTQGPDPQDSDELLLIQEGAYYGHPNRNRGRYDPRQNVYHGTGMPSDGLFTQAVTTLPSSTDGIVEYRANTFRGAMRGELLAQQWNGATFRIRLTPSGLGVQTVNTLSPSLGSLDIVTGPGGALLGPDYSAHSLVLLRPNDMGAVGLTVYDVFPWRALASGGQDFVIGGSGFGSLADTSVTIGGNPATLTAVSATRIRGIVPAVAVATPELLDVQVRVGSQAVTLPAAFRYVLEPGTEPDHDTWLPASSLPFALGEVAGGVLGDLLVLVGEGSPATLALDLVSDTWTSGRAMRPFPGHHHSAEVVDGKLHLIGGLGGGSEGRVQIYDPVADLWSPGADMPWGGGSISTAAIGGKIYAAGGIVGSSTVTNCAVYDPQLDIWTPLAPMPVGRNHAAAGTDGHRFYVFGGRGPGSGDGNTVANGFADLMIYDPTSDAWEWSGAAGSTLPPLPQARGGMGKAVYHGGEFYVLGGETLNGPGATAAGVYDRVDVYDPAAKVWRLAAPMPTARHGIFPMRYRGEILVPGGGVQAAFSQSMVHEVYTP